MVRKHANWLPIIYFTIGSQRLFRLWNSIYLLQKNWLHDLLWTSFTINLLCRRIKLVYFYIYVNVWETSYKFISKHQCDKVTSSRLRLIVDCRVYYIQAILFVQNARNMLFSIPILTSYMSCWNDFILINKAV